MGEYRFRIHKDTLTDGSILKEASADELRVLLALIANDGVVASDALAKMCGCSEARIKSAIALFSAEGVITPEGEARIVDEFRTSHIAGGDTEESMVEVARTVRDAKLQEVLDDFTKRIGKGALRHEETAKITNLAKEYGFSAEFISLYMAHLDGMGKLKSAAALCSGAKRLFDMQIRELDSLEAYIKHVESSSFAESEIKSALGIFRQLAPSERDYIRKWTEDFLYSTPIVSLAYDITVLNTNKVSFKYMDTLLSDWHSAGCKTEAECKARHEAKGKELAKNTSVSSKRDAKPKLKYGDFDPEEALKNAIRNSGFFDDDDED